MSWSYRPKVVKSGAWAPFEGALVPQPKSELVDLELYGLASGGAPLSHPAGEGGAGGYTTNQWREERRWENGGWWVKCGQCPWMGLMGGGTLRA